MTTLQELDERIVALRRTLDDAAFYGPTGLGRLYRTETLVNLADALLQRASHEQADPAGRLKDVDDVVRLVEQELPSVDDSDPRKRGLHGRLGAALTLRDMLLMGTPHDRPLDTADRERAISILSDLLASPEATPQDAALAHMMLGTLFLLRALPRDMRTVLSAQAVEAGGMLPPSNADAAAFARAIGLGGERIRAEDIDVAVAHLTAAAQSPILNEEQRRAVQARLNMAHMLRAAVQALRGVFPPGMPVPDFMRQVLEGGIPGDRVSMERIIRELSGISMPPASTQPTPTPFMPLPSASARTTSTLPPSGGTGPAPVAEAASPAPPQRDKATAPGTEAGPGAGQGVSSEDSRASDAPTAPRRDVADEAIGGDEVSGRDTDEAEADDAGDEDLLWRMAVGLRRRNVGPGRLRRRPSAETGAAALREAAYEVVLQPNTRAASHLARRTARRAHTVAAWWLELDAPDAEAEALRAEALRALELGRGILSHVATSARSTTEILEAAGQGTLAARWRRWQDAASARKGLPAGPPPDGLRRRVATALMDAGVLGRLLDPPSAEEIAGALRTAGSDALVYLVPRIGGAPGRALVVHADARLSSIVLPELRDDQEGTIARYAQVPHWGSYGGDDPDGQEDAMRRAALGDLCGWAWSAAMGPLLADAASWERPDAEQPPRLTLVPCGMLGIVPWHAARTKVDAGPADGQSSDGESTAVARRPYRYACESAVISYAATGRQLLDAASRGLLEPAARPVLLGSPRDPTTRMTALAVRGIREMFHPAAPTYGQVGLRRAGAGTPQEVLSWLPGTSGTPASLLHLGCHALATNDPARSCLELAVPEGEGAGTGGGTDGGRLSVAAILSQGAAGSVPPTPGGTVILADETTDIADADHDEALTLPSALLAAGASGVVGPRWPVLELRAVVLTFMLHHFLAAHGNTADALRQTCLWMLDPQREIPRAMPRGLAEEVRRRQVGDVAGRLDLADVHGWAAFTHHGMAGGPADRGGWHGERRS